ncbi:MAG: substrate-binding domain-containing protein [Deltaproteobacteria bacterium]|nr:substrate-binding domain-containing protein [Deltaproteobacteria bacterium]
MPHLNQKKSAHRKTKHRQVFEHLLADIESEKLKEGDRLPTEAELVKQFGASRPTVARALHDLQNIGLVERKVGSGTYVNRSQKKGKSWQFGLLIPGLGSTEIFEPVCGQIARLAQKQHHTLLWGDFGEKQGDPDRALIDQVCQSYIRQSVAGVFFAPLELTEDKDRVNRSVIASMKSAGIPIVLLDRDIVPFPQRSNLDLVGIDNRQAGFLITNHFIRLGCERIDFLSRPDSAPTVMLRMAGYREALLNSRILPDPKWIHTGDPSDRDFVRTITDDGATAIICANDLTAANLMRTLDVLGCPVPQKVRVAGFDDVRYAELLRPSLTTIHQPCTDIGTIAMQVMLERIKNPTIPSRDILVQPTLIVRQSCGAA